MLPLPRQRNKQPERGTLSDYYPFPGANVGFHLTLREGRAFCIPHAKMMNGHVALVKSLEACKRSFYIGRILRSTVGA